MILKHIHQNLAKLYDLDRSLPIEAFSCDEHTARAAVGDDIERGEVVWFREHDDEIAIGLYVEKEALDLLATTETWQLANQSHFQAFCLAAEGVSHVAYLHHRGSRGHKVSLLELELQAEIDKYALALLQGQGAGVIMERSRHLRRHLFEKTSFIDHEHSEAGERYRTASRHAARLAKYIEEHFVHRGALGELATFLRRFYRKNTQGKLESCRKNSVE
ncbi:MAG: hypothetical protein IPJ88_12785 [Myxococcales bacterium]|nr:MAG: hypothetical protein IPJ88_12785 [Myxococcales bacterium]